jgi:hypothetical protein
MKIYRYVGKNNDIGGPYIKFAYYSPETPTIKVVFKNGKSYVMSNIELSKDLYVELNDEEKLELL